MTAVSLIAIVRDFRFYAATEKTTNPDFENPPPPDENGAPNSAYRGPWHDWAIVTGTLGADRKPVYSASGSTLTTHGKASFDQWYRDVRGTNVRRAVPITFTRAPSGASEYDSEKSGVL